MMTEKTADHGQMNSRVRFFDDFRSGTLDRSKWNVRVTGPVYNNEQQAYIDSTETLYILPAEQVPEATHGVLVFHPRSRPGFLSLEGKRFDFISGRIDTKDKFDFQYGTAATRIKLPSGAGLWPAFWILGYDNWPGSGEIDVLEYIGEPDWVSSAVHGTGYFGEAGLANNFYFPDGSDATAWHTYAVDWTPDSLFFKVDDRLIYRVTRPMTDFFGPWAFNNRKYLILNFALGGIYPFKINGVQSPYYGLPASTVEMIKNDQIQVMVDWVQVKAYE